MKAFRLLAPVLVLALGACAYPYTDTTVHTGACPSGVAEATASVDWATAKTLTFTIEEGGHVTPMSTHVFNEQPYVFKFTNTDTATHKLDDLDFYHDQAVASVRVGDQTTEAPCMWALSIPAETEGEIRFVARKQGRYEFGDYPLLYVPHTRGVTTFVATVK